MKFLKSRKFSRYLSVIKIGAVASATICILVYVSILEPYCFFKSWVNADDISHIQLSSIESYGSYSTDDTNKNLIVMLIPRFSSKLIKRLEQLDKNFDDNYSTSILFLYTHDLSKRDGLRVTKLMKRKVFFLNIFKVFNLFPIGLDACKTRTSYRVRGKWNYLLMIRFWFKTIFELPQLHRYEYLMRLDDDSKLLDRWFNVFDEMHRKNAVYFANNIDVDIEDQLPGTLLIKELIDNYTRTNNIQPKQISMLENAFFNRTVKNFYNNFEVSKVEFFRRKEVQQWVDAIDASLGIFKYRWGDAVLRYFTIALFADETEVLHRKNYNLSYCHKCN